MYKISRSQNPFCKESTRGIVTWLENTRFLASESRLAACIVTQRQLTLAFAITKGLPCKPKTSAILSDKSLGRAL